MRPPRKGFTLLEIMIALAFIGVALVAVIQAQGQGLKLTDQVRFTSRTVFLARELMAEAQTLPGLTDGVGTAGHTGFYP
ncbi:MAG: prepilin-type N-terminal cleavage/methylation domain-containing protein [Deltaproteobacteria bacterium]|nr:prepilin-type N-terminal cleavage/methylation domain-containing protein [Deltaproteobacteria bacterium]